MKFLRDYATIFWVRPPKGLCDLKSLSSKLYIVAGLYERPRRPTRKHETRQHKYDWINIPHQIYPYGSNARLVVVIYRRITSRSHLLKKKTQKNCSKLRILVEKVSLTLTTHHCWNYKLSVSPQNLGIIIKVMIWRRYNIGFSAESPWFYVDWKTVCVEIR